MFHTQGNTQVYSPFGSFVVEQHDAGFFKRHIEDQSRFDLIQSKELSLAPLAATSAVSPDTVSGTTDRLAPRLFARLQEQWCR